MFQLENFVLGLNLTEFHSGFRAFNVDALKKIPFKELSNDYHFDHEVMMLLAITKKKIVENVKLNIFMVCFFTKTLCSSSPVNNLRSPGLVSLSQLIYTQI